MITDKELNEICVLLAAFYPAIQVGAVVTLDGPVGIERHTQGG